MEFKLHNGSGGLCCKSCGRQDKQLNTYDWLADIPGNAEESDMVEVQFKNTRKGYFRNSNKIPLEKGDIVAVEATPGHDIGVVTLPGGLYRYRCVRQISSRKRISSASTAKPNRWIWTSITRRKRVNTAR